MNKIFIFDADEVVLRRELYFSQRLAMDFGIPEDEIMKFFKNEYKDCAVGKSDLKEILERYVKIWGWRSTVDDLMKYWFENERGINEKVVAEIKNLKKIGYTCCLATNNEKFRTQYLLNEVGLKDLFDHIFSSYEIGFLKSENEFWEFVQDKIGADNPNMIIVCDNDEHNIKKVNELGMKGFLFGSEKEFENKIHEIINQERRMFNKVKIM